MRVIEAPNVFAQQDIFRRRLPIVGVALIIASLILLARLASFQFQLSPEVVGYLEGLRDSGYRRTLEEAAARGGIYDRRGEALAVNTLEYRVGVSPILISEPRESANDLAAVLGMDELTTYQAVTSDEAWELLKSPVSAEVGQRVLALDILGVTMEPIPRRSYPQGELAAQVVGFVGGDLVGYYGVEGYYQDQLAGRVRSREISNIPFELLQSTMEENAGRNLVLTIDRDVQYIVEEELTAAIAESAAASGTILVMNPRTGDILAMANWPTYDPNAYFNIQDASLLRNPSIGEQYEPGSIMKVITMGIALDLGVITPQWSYVDEGVMNQGGIEIRNWDNAPHGYSDATAVIVESLNIGAATLNLMVGPMDYYQKMDRFGFGRLTGVDMQGEEAGTMFLPGDPDWSEAMFLTSSYGQGIAVTPLQMLTAVNAIANDGLMMQPRIVHQIVDTEQVYTSQPTALGRPIGAESAHAVRDMMIAAVRDGLDGTATVRGYSIAGKTGTAQIPAAVNYYEGASIASFVGFFPADDPQVSILIKLDRPRDIWGSVVAAPVFQRLAERLAIQLEIPPDDIRLQLELQAQAAGG